MTRLRSLLAVCIVAAAGCGQPQLQVTPSKGRQSGGERLRIEGQGFSGHGPAVIYVGSRAAKAVVIESDELITVMTPQTAEPSTVSIRIEFRDGEVVELTDAFTYTAEEGIVLQPEIGFGD